MKKIKNLLYAFMCLFLVIILLAGMFLPKQTLKVNALELPSENYDLCTAKSMCVLEQNSKRVLLCKDKDIRLPMASTTKIMTALIALENCTNLDEQFKTDNRAVGVEGTSIYLRKDETLSMRELLYGLMLNSGNDAATAIAYKIGNGDINKFVELMNQKAVELNLQNTHFDNPHGLDSKTHYTSSYDLAVITAKAMEDETFREIVKTEVKQISCQKEMGSRFVRNKHKLLKTMQGCDGVKTGFTDNARRCCVTSCVRNDMRLICVVLNCNDMFLESQKCLEKCFDNYEYTTLLEPYKFIDSTNVNDGVVDKVKLFIKDGYKFPLREDEKEKIRFEIKFDEMLEAPVEKHAEVGEIKIYFENDLIYCEKIYTIEEVKEKNITDKMKDIFEQWYF